MIIIVTLLSINNNRPQNIVDSENEGEGKRGGELTVGVPNFAAIVTVWDERRYSLILTGS